VLGERPVGVDDDFFELGGDSLTAARMIQQVGELTGRALPLGALYESPTVAGLARRLRADGPAPAGAAPAVTLNRGGDRTPLVLFHGMLTGGAFYALRLARRLGPRQPVHVVAPFTGEGQPVPATVEAMAGAQLGLVRALQPRGPYRLAGYCNGGLVAYEVARRLREAGETVELLALIAAAPVTPLAGAGRLLRRAARLAGLPPEPVAEPLARVRSLVEALSALPRRRRPAFVAAKGLLLARRAWRRRASPARDTPPDLMEVYHRVVMRYFPRRAPGAVVVFWPEQEPWGPADAAAAAWRRLVPAVDAHVVPGDHLAVVHDHLDVLAERLAPYLDGRAAPSRRAPATLTERLRLGLPPVFVELPEALERAWEISRCLA
jgi:thioesterase domain-containing protein